METSPITRTIQLRPDESHIVDGTTILATGEKQFKVSSPTGFGEHNSETAVTGAFAMGHFFRENNGDQKFETIVYETV